MDLLDVLAETDPDVTPEPATKEEWVSYVLADAFEAPQLPPYETYLTLAEDERLALDARRVAHQSAGPLVRTPDYEQIRTAIIETMLANRRAPDGAKRGVVVDGPPTVGKSTLIKRVARDYELKLRARYPERFDDTGGDDYRPVVFIPLPAAASPKTLSVRFDEFFASPGSGTRARPGTGRRTSRANMAEITSRVVATLKGCRTTLVVIDDVHYIDCSQREGRLSNDHLKNLANMSGATFVLAGVNVRDSGLFDEGGRVGRHTQTAGRYSVYPMSYLGVGSKQERLRWAGTIKSFEETFGLYRHQPGYLAANHWQYLHDRTQGRLSALSTLLRAAAQQAVVSGDETVTVEHLDAIKTDTSTQRAFEEARAKRKKRRTRSTTSATGKMKERGAAKATRVRAASAATEEKKPAGELAAAREPKAVWA